MTPASLGAWTVVTLLLVAGAARAAPEQAAGAGRLTDVRLLLVPPRVDVTEVAPGGLTLLKAEWTDAATRDTRTALDRVLSGTRASVLAYAAPADTARADRHAQVIKVHALVRAAIIAHGHTHGRRLPSITRFEWSVGPAAAALRDGQATATHALFVEIAETRLSRHFVTVGSLANEFTGSASVLDLATGDILWFNYERSGSLGSAADTLAAVKRLLRDLPF